MSETPLELVKRMQAEGRPTGAIREALNGAPNVQPPQPAASPAALAPGRIDTSWLMYIVGPWIGWVLLVACWVIPAVAVVSTAIYVPGFSRLATAILGLGGITGAVGLVIYAQALVLSTRARWLEDLFGGLSHVLAAHDTLGRLSLFFVLAHPLLAAGSYYQSGLQTVALFFWPQSKYIGVAFGIVALVLMIVLLGLTLYAHLGYKLWLRTHKYLGFVYLLVGFHVILTPNHVGSVNSLLRYYTYLVLLVGVAAYIYRTLLPNIFVRRYLYTIVSADHKGVGVVEVTLAPVEQKIRFRAGQFVFLSFNNDALSPEWHPFSISSAETSDNLRIDIKSLGAYTETLTRLLPYMVGMTVRLEGAYGRFSYHNFGNTMQIWVAGGIGITPFLSMAQALGEGPYNIDLYYSVNTESELVDLNILSAKLINQPDKIFRVFPFVSEKYNAFLNAEDIIKNSGDLSGRDILLCGPAAMIHDLTSQLVAKGIPLRHIHSEEFGLR